MSVEQKIVGKKFRNLRGGTHTVHTLHCYYTAHLIWANEASKHVVPCNNVP